MAKRGRKPGDGRGRYGGGIKLGQKQKKTLAKEAARELVRTTITRELQPLVDAQVANAKGLKYLVVRDKKTGKFLRVGEASASNPREETIEVWEKDPSIHAFAELLNRALDKPAEQIKHTGDEGGPIEHVLRWRK